MTIFTVNTAADAVADDGKLSLREALALADSDPATADTIIFDGSVQGQTILLAGSELTVSFGRLRSTVEQASRSMRITRAEY